MLISLLTTLALAAPTTAAPTAPAGLREVILFSACKRAGYVVYADKTGATRLLERVRMVPDNTSRLTQRYDARGRLTTVQASASGFAGLRYDLTVQFDSRGRVVSERGYRAKGEQANIRTLMVDPRAVRAGRCP
ncbi:hypothetical protein [Deinococcus maricopensis]|uniref:Uncharacterized protein n=1 Tax=Deinococcus maricopensis (strain DSM 21211 / LMG 22137 / NRRL B-23946 / LB-34) TaxID=709986 RepID=E8U9E1_DEIML|nr:hypothetical protein [Deinococcus maricopensis]ADV67680.1 hypothetical protein Deima_2037 [Deinococcus maricopensis DSM 21211]